MNVFVVFKVSDHDKMDAAIKKQYPGDHLKLQTDEWLLADSATAKDVSDKIGATDGSSGSAIIFKMDSYYGRAATDIWDWVKTKSEAKATND